MEEGAIVVVQAAVFHAAPVQVVLWHGDLGAEHSTRSHEHGKQDSMQGAQLVMDAPQGR